jgi:hypothetical protein
VRNRAARPVPAALTALIAVVALLALAACGQSTETNASQQPQGASLRITIGTQEFPEGRIIGELWRQALAVNGYAVDLRKGVGPAADLDQSLKDGDIDGYVAYTGTVLSIVAGEREEVSGLDPQKTYDKAKAFYAGQDMVMSEMTPFQNRDAIATTRRYAEAHSLRTIADLRDVDRFALGVSRACSGSTGSPTRGSLPSPWARSTRRWTTATRTRSTPSPPIRSWRPATTRSSRTPSCCSARRTSSWWWGRRSSPRSTRTRSWEWSTRSTPS